MKSWPCGPPCTTHLGSLSSAREDMSDAWRFSLMKIFCFRWNLKVNHGALDVSLIASRMRGDLEQIPGAVFSHTGAGSQCEKKRFFFTLGESFWFFRRSGTVSFQSGVRFRAVRAVRVLCPGFCRRGPSGPLRPDRFAQTVSPASPGPLRPGRFARTALRPDRFARAALPGLQLFGCRVCVYSDLFFFASRQAIVPMFFLFALWQATVVSCSFLL